MRSHFRHLRFKSFPTVPRAQQSMAIWPFNSHSEVSGVHRDSLSHNGSCLGSVSAHSLTLPRTSLNSQEYVMTPGLPLGPHPSNAFAFAPELPSFWLLGFLPSSWLPGFLATPCLGREPKARVATRGVHFLFSILFLFSWYFFHFSSLEWCCEWFLCAMCRWISICTILHNQRCF